MASPVAVESKKSELTSYFACDFYFPSNVEIVFIVHRCAAFAFGLISLEIPKFLGVIEKPLVYPPHLVSKQKGEADLHLAAGRRPLAHGVRLRRCLML